MYSMVDDPREDRNEARVGELGEVVEQLSKQPCSGWRAATP